jgi:dTDP-4-dehydrorhamnose 3,5-epimerase
MEFHDGPIDGVVLRPLARMNDSRGWLCELFRIDELAPDLHPAMAYVSESLPGITRGPHEHVDQSDLFCFMGPSQFRVVMWDNRPGSPSAGARTEVVAGEANPMLIVIPPGVVHAYTNIGPHPGWVFNCPNRLYRGIGRKHAVDEIRHEDEPNSLFKI